MDSLNDAVDLFVSERIQEVVKQNTKSNRKENDEVFERADRTISSLPDQERNYVEAFIQSIYNQMAVEECLLYRAGFKDGIRMMELLKAITEGEKVC